jgi:predicted PurR-regulated permease PerM
MDHQALAARTVVRTVLIVVAVFVCLYLIYLLRKPIGWLLIAAFLAIALSGPVNVLHRYMKRGFAIAIVYLALLMIPVGIGAAIVPPIVNGAEDLAQNAPAYANDITEFVNENERLQKLNDDYDITAKLQEEAAKLPEKLGDAAGILSDVGLGIVNSIFAVVTILILTAFMLGGGRRWITLWLRFAPEDRAERIERVVDRSARAVGNYVAGALAQALVAAIARSSC